MFDLPLLVTIWIVTLNAGICSYLYQSMNIFCMPPLQMPALHPCNHPFCWDRKDHGVDSHTMSPKLIRILRTVFVLARDKSLAQTLSKIYSTWKATMIRLYRWMLQDAFVACWIKFGASRVSCIRKCVKHFSKQSCKLQQKLATRFFFHI